MEKGIFTPEALQHHIGETVTLHGSINKIRHMSGFAFVVLRLRRGVIQCIYAEDQAQFPLTLLHEEQCVEATGIVLADSRSRIGCELHLQTIQILSEPVESLPLVIHNKKIDASLSTFFQYRPVTLRNESQRAVFRIQDAACRGFRSFLHQEGFTEIHTPKLVQTGAEGGANIFQLDYFGKEAYLAQSPQFYKQMMVAVYERVYEIAPVYRAEKHDTSRHLNEYISVDMEMGYIKSFTEIMEAEEEMLKFALGQIQEDCPQELELLKVSMPKTGKIPAIPFHESKELVARTYHREILDEGDFDPEEEKLLCEIMYRQTGSEFVFVTHYPSYKRPFYAMDDPADPQRTLSFDLLFRGLEITTGGQRIHCYREQIGKMQDRGMNIESFETYLMAHKYGLPPHGGLGLGLERFTSRLLGLDNVRYGSLFPRDTNRITP